MGSAGHSSLLGVIVLVGECCFVVGWVCLVGVDVGVGIGVGVARRSVSFLRCSHATHTKKLLLF